MLNRCSNTKCDLRTTCARYSTIADDAFFPEDGKCDHYLEVVDPKKHTNVVNLFTSKEDRIEKLITKLREVVADEPNGKVTNITTLVSTDADTFLLMSTLDTGPLVLWSLSKAAKYILED